MCSTLFACNNQDEIAIKDESDDMVTVSLNLGGELNVSESPLTRAFDSSKDLCGIEVYKGTSRFAWGLFDDFSNVKINLLKGHKYKFVCLLVKDGQNILYSDRYNNYGHYYYPYYELANNVFEYTNSSSFSLQSGYYRLKNGNGYVNYDYPIADSYYAELADYTPEVDGTINLELKHVVFGLQYKVTGITDGSVAVTIKNAKQIFVSKSNIASDFVSDEQIITFYDRQSAWQYADNYTENLTLGVKWTRENGIVQDLGTTEVQVKRNVMNILHIKLGASDGSATIGIKTEDDSSMKAESANVTLGS